MSNENRIIYPFQKGLAIGQRLEIFAADPNFAVMAKEGLLPAYGEKTKQARADAAAMMVFGAATVLFGSDRAAEAELAYQWPLIRPVLTQMGMAVDPVSPTANSWRYFRGKLTWEVIADLKAAFHELEARRAVAMGLFPAPAEPYDYMAPDHRHTVYADGTWFLPASEVGIRGHESRATVGSPTLARDLDERANATGYCHVFILARLPEERMRLVLDFERARDADEIPVVLEALAGIRSRVGDGLRHFVYDRAFSGHDHVRFVVERGMLPITKPARVDAFSDWRQILNTKWKGNVTRFDMSFDGCVHRCALNQGMLWELDQDNRGGLIYARVAEHLSIDRYQRSNGTYGFKIGMQLRCNGRFHRFTMDLTEPNEVMGRNVTMGINLKPHLVSDEEVSKGAYSIRSDVESSFSRFKNHMGMGRRAGSLDPRSHEVDLLLLSMVNNALAFAEWRQRYEGRRRAA